RLNKEKGGQPGPVARGAAAPERTVARLAADPDRSEGYGRPAALRASSCRRAVVNNLPRADLPNGGRGRKAPSWSSGSGSAAGVGTAAGVQRVSAVTASNRRSSWPRQAAASSG